MISRDQLEKGRVFPMLLFTYPCGCRPLPSIDHIDIDASIKIDDFPSTYKPRLFDYQDSTSDSIDSELPRTDCCAFSPLGLLKSSRTNT